MVGVTLRCVGKWYLCLYSDWEHRLLGHVMLSGTVFTKTVTGFAVRGILKERIFPIPVVSKFTIASQNSASAVRGILKERIFPIPVVSKFTIASRNSASAIPRKLRLALCLNALKVKTGPANRMQAVFTANCVGWGFSSSIVGVTNSLRN